MPVTTAAVTPDFSQPVALSPQADVERGE